MRNQEEPSRVMTPKDLKYKNAYIRKDEFASDPADTFHIFDITGYSNWLDQLDLYANITKPSGKRESYTLDYIGNYEVGEKKREYDGDIKDLHLRNYKQFILYNIQDVVLLSHIENKLKHIDLLYNISMLTNTRISKALRKTVSIRNFGEESYFESGKVMGNNHSELYPDAGKIPGALTVFTLRGHSKLYELLEPPYLGQSAAKPKFIVSIYK